MGVNHIFLLLLLPFLVQSQIWKTGDNSTCADCNDVCGNDVSCWKKTLNFYEKTLIAHLRNYISAQIDYDQWHRRHEKPKVQDYDAMTQRIQNQFTAQLHSDDPEEVLLGTTVSSVATTLSNRIKDISTGKMDKVPLYECPILCNEKEKTMQLTFGLSIILNLLAAATVIPVFLRSLRPDSDHDEKTEARDGLVNNAYSE